MLMAIPKESGIRMLVKNQYPADAANEYIACFIGRRIGVNCPRAFLFENKYAVGIEYFDNFRKFDIKEAAPEEIAGIVVLNAITANIDDSIQMSGITTNGRLKVFTYDFASAFGFSRYMFSALIRTKKASVAKQMIQQYKTNLLSCTSIVQVARKIAGKDVRLECESVFSRIMELQPDCFTQDFDQVFPLEVSVVYECIIEQLQSMLKIGMAK